MKRAVILISLCLLFISSFSHSGKPDYHIIIDTDGAIDDMRTITMFLAEEDFRILAITCSQGSVKSNSAYQKVNSLLHSLHNEKVRLGIGKDVNKKLPTWNDFAENIQWGNKSVENKKTSNSNFILNESTKNYKSKITLVALGSLKTYADWLSSNPDAIKKIDRIIWQNDKRTKAGFNYKISPNSYQTIKELGVPIEIVSEKMLLEKAYLGMIEKTNSIYAKQIAKVHQQKSVETKIKNQHLYLWDDFIPIYLLHPELFNNTLGHISLKDSITPSIIYEEINEILLSGTLTNNRVFHHFPDDPNLYLPEYSSIIKSTIEKYGTIEWKAIALTNEIHGHTGIYSIIGAKMGIRAMEYFNVGINNLNVTSFAGSKPPLSCLNDGIQISTGCTIGQGLITISDSISKTPSVIFEFNGQKVLITLKPEITSQIQKDIKRGVDTYGINDDYWEYIEHLGIKYWTDLNRYQIFTLKDIE